MLQTLVFFINNCIACIYFNFDNENSTLLKISQNTIFIVFSYQKLWIIEQDQQKLIGMSVSNLNAKDLINKKILKMKKWSDK